MNISTFLKKILDIAPIFSFRKLLSTTGADAEGLFPFLSLCFHFQARGGSIFLGEIICTYLEMWLKLNNTTYYLSTLMMFSLDCFVFG